MKYIIRYVYYYCAESALCSVRCSKFRWVNANAMDSKERNGGSSFICRTFQLQKLMKMYFVQGKHCWFADIPGETRKRSQNSRSQMMPVCTVDSINPVFTFPKEKQFRQDLSQNCERICCQWHQKFRAQTESYSKYAVCQIDVEILSNAEPQSLEMLAN